MHKKLLEELKSLRPFQFELAKKYWHIKFGYKKISEMDNGEIVDFLEEINRIKQP